MIALGIFALCVNVQSFGVLIKVLPSSLCCGSDSAVLFRMGQRGKKSTCFLLLPGHFHTAARVLNSEKLSKELLFSWYWSLCLCAKMSCLKKNIVHTWNCEWADISSTPGKLVWTSQEKIPCAVPIRLACAFALRARNVDASLNPKPFLWKPIYRVMQKSVVLTVPYHTEKALCSVCLPPSPQRKHQMGLFFFFNGSRDVALTLCLSSCAWLALGAGHAVRQQGSRVWACGALLTAERLQ